MRPAAVGQRPADGAHSPRLRWPIRWRARPLGGRLVAKAGKDEDCQMRRRGNSGSIPHRRSAVRRNRIYFIDRLDDTEEDQRCPDVVQNPGWGVKPTWNPLNAATGIWPSVVASESWEPP